MEIPNSKANDRITAALENLSYELKQIRNNKNDKSLTGYGTPVNRAIDSLKSNIDAQFEEAQEHLRDSSPENIGNNKSRRVNNADPPRVPKNLLKEQENAPAARVPTISDARSRFKVGTEISKKFDGISYK